MRGADGLAVVWLALGCRGPSTEPDTCEPVTWYVDADGDGWGLESRPFDACEAPAGHVARAGDCDDADPELTPDSVWYADADGDGHAGQVAVVACERPRHHLAGPSDDCDDTDAHVYPGADEVCDDGQNNDCTDAGVDCDHASCTLDPECAPVIEAIAPDVGPRAGGTLLNVTGSGFAWATTGPVEVRLDGALASEVEVASGTELTCRTPPGQGTVDVSVRTASGESVASDAFRYIPSVLFAADGRAATAGSLYRVDLDTHAITEVGALGAALSGLAFAPDGTLYGVTSYRDDGARLLTIDPVTAVTTEVGTLSSPAGTVAYAVSDIAFVGSDLVGWAGRIGSEGRSDVPIGIDPETAEIVMLRSGVDAVGGGVAADASGRVWLSTGPNLLLFDPTSGAVSAGAVLANDIGSPRFAAMCWRAGTLYAVRNDGEATRTVLVELDTATGGVRAVLDLPAGVDALAAPPPVEGSSGDGS